MKATRGNVARSPEAIAKANPEAIVRMSPPAQVEEVLTVWQEVIAELAERLASSPLRVRSTALLLDVAETRAADARAICASSEWTALEKIWARRYEMDVSELVRVLRAELERDDDTLITSKDHPAETWDCGCPFEGPHGPDCKLATVARDVAENRSMSLAEAGIALSRAQPGTVTRETVGFEVVIRFFPGSEEEAREFARTFKSDQATQVRLDRIVKPGGEERVVEFSRAPAGAIGCSNCGASFADHCRVHLFPCCPGKCPGRAAERDA